MNSNTVENSKPPRQGQFKKGDPRINRKGRPKSFDALRELAQEIAHEAAQAGGQDIVINGHKVTVSEAILRQWAQSKNPQLQRAFIEVAFGKVPDVTQLTGPNGGPIQTEDVTLSDDERANRIASLLDAARARKAGQVTGNSAGELQE